MESDIDRARLIAYELGRTSGLFVSKEALAKSEGALEGQKRHNRRLRDWHQSIKDHWSKLVNEGRVSADAFRAVYGEDA